MVPTFVKTENDALAMLAHLEKLLSQELATLPSSTTSRRDYRPHSIAWKIDRGGTPR